MPVTPNQLFTHLLALSVTKRDSKRRAYWLCRCSCGQTSEVREDNLLSGRTISCGCQRIKTTGRRNQKSAWSVANGAVRWSVEIWQSQLVEDVPGHKAHLCFAVVHKKAAFDPDHDTNPFVEDPYYVTSKVSRVRARKGPLGTYQENVLYKLHKAGMIGPKGSMSAVAWAQREGVEIRRPVITTVSEVRDTYAKVVREAERTGNDIYI